MKRINATELVDRRVDSLVLDARSPSEFAAGHIPGAVSLPIFDDEERARVGTTYKSVGSIEATLEGLDIAGPKMRGLVEQAMGLAPNKQAIVHCWRGGQRSGALAWLLSFSGFEIDVVEGGYKAYRSLIQETVANPNWPFIVIGGKTGSGKTELLAGLAKAGEQIVDLEGLANHKGSAFGWIGEDPQPSSEQFENNLYDILRELDPEKRIWLENESRGIGHVFLPVAFMNTLTSSPLLNVVVGQDERVRRLSRMYASNRDELVQSFSKIKKKLGGQHFQAALEAIERNDIEAATKIALVYYDKTYQYGLDNTNASSVTKVDLTDMNLTEKVAKLIRVASETPTNLSHSL